MTRFAYSVTLIVPTSGREAANRLSKALGRDAADPPKTFVVPLSGDGSKPATHFGCHAWADQSFVDLLTAAGEGTLPEVDWEAFGLTEARVFEVLGGMISHVTTGKVGFDDALTANGLQRVEVEEHD